MDTESCRRADVGGRSTLCGSWAGNITSDNTVDEGWTIPWGLQISKVTNFGARPVNLLFGYYSYSTTPEGGADSQYRFQINFMFPKAP